jgi:hypothetical protein
MANELRIASVPGQTIYAQIVNSSGRWWNGSTFEAYNSSNYSLYNTTMLEQGSTGVYMGTFPAGITSSGSYDIFYFSKQGGSPAEGDPLVGTGRIVWTGTAVESSVTSTGTLTAAQFLAYIIRSLGRTDVDDLIYDALTDTIADIRRNLHLTEDEVDQTITDTINTIGTYQMELEADTGLLVSGVYLQDTTEGRNLVSISKGEWDRRYGIWGTNAEHRAKPEAYCLFGGHILLGPVPDSTSYNYRISFTSDPHLTVTASTTSIPYSDKYREMLKMGTLARVYSDLNMDNQAAKFGTLYTSQMKEIEKKEDRNRRITTSTAYCDF